MVWTVNTPKRLLSVVIPTLNAAQSLSGTLKTLGPSPFDMEVIVIDSGSTDNTCDIAKSYGAQILSTEVGRGRQLVAGASAATGSWLLFLHADTRLSEDWVHQVDTFMNDPSNICRAAYFRFRLDDKASQARWIERLVAWRCRVIGLPYGDQGLLIQRSFYLKIGGFKPLELMEDVDIVRRIGIKKLSCLETDAVTSAEKYQHSGYLMRSLRNLGLLSLYFLGLPPRFLVKLYG